MDGNVTVKDDRLIGDGVTQEESPNHGGAMAPKYLIIHYTAAPSMDNAVKHFRDPIAKASAHVVIGRDGAVCQMVPFNVVAWHAGISTWNGIQGLNRCSIGIELDNPGRLTEVEGELQAWFGRRYPTNEAVHVRHKNETEPAWWPIYPEAQLSALRAVASALVSSYRLSDILGHEDIAPGRKSDPGPAFPMASFKAALLGRQADTAATWRVAASHLNMRRGPGTEFPPVREALVEGTRLVQLDATSTWMKVALAQDQATQGWVNAKYLEHESEG